MSSGLLLGAAQGLVLAALLCWGAAVAAGARAIRAGHGGWWLLWDGMRFWNPARAPEAARPALRSARRRALAGLGCLVAAALLALPGIAAG